MATRDEIKKAILDVSGNPEAGIIPAWVDRWADAIVALDAPEVEEKPKKVKETRIITPDEER